MSKEKQNEYGCVVCTHIVRCGSNPFGICKEFEQKEATDEQKE